MVSKITALYDWIFEEKHGAGVVNDFAVMVAKKAVNSFVRTPYAVSYTHLDVYKRQIT